MKNEKRLVDANELKKKKTILWDEALGFCECVLIDDIDDAQTVDAVEVVRCKDCKRYVWDEFDGAYVCISIGKYVKPDFWCANGERKDNGKT